MRPVAFPKDDLQPFASAEHLLNGAQEGLYRYAEGVRTFLNENKPYVVHQVDPPTSENIYYLRFPAAVPLELRHIVGSVAVALRHSLDHALGDAAIQLGRADADNVSFPVGRSVEDLERNIKRHCRDVHPNLIDLCRSQEPYQYGKGELVWAMSRLAGAHKHRRLVHLVQKLTHIWHPIDGTYFTGPIRLDNIWTDKATEIEFARGVGEIHGTITFHTSIVINTEAAGIVIQGNASLSEVYSTCNSIVGGLKAEVARLNGTRCP